MKYNLKQGGEKQQFSTGAQRDSQEGKSRPDLISPVFLFRLGDLLAKGAEHYGERNWEKGMPLSRVLASAMRHLIQTEDGLEDEDHAIQCAFNIMVYVHTLHRIRAGLLPAELDDLPREKNLESKPVKCDLPKCSCCDFDHCPLCAQRLGELKDLAEKNLESDLTSDKKPPTIEHDRSNWVPLFCPNCQLQFDVNPNTGWKGWNYDCPICGRRAV